MEKSKILEFKNKMRQQLKATIQIKRAPILRRKNSLIRQAYQPNFFLDLKSEKESISKSYQSLFEQQEKIGEGAQSVVRKVIEKSSQNTFAVKIFNKTDIQKIMRIKKVYLVVCSLNFPTILKYSYLFISHKTNTARVVMDYCSYPTLESVMKNYECFSQGLASTIIKILLETIAYIHSKRICHRDIKPSNILYNINSIDDKSSLKLIDYDICQHSNKTMIQMWTATGSLFYKAPEMFKGSYDEKIDIWSCGIIAYQLLHGCLPFTHQFFHQTIQQITSETIQPKISQHLDPFARQFIKKCLNKNPHQRLSATQALKHPFILQADSGSVTPRADNKLNNSFQYQHKQCLMKRSPSAGIMNTMASFTEAAQCIINDGLWY